jgi:anti-sigma factor RsiW
MTCERIERLLSDYLEGGLTAAARAEADAHLAGCPDCAALLALMRETLAATAGFPEAEPSAALMARLYAVPEEAAAAKAGRRSLARTVFDWLGRPSLQPVYAAGAAVLMALTFVAFHPEARGIRKRIDVGFHRTVGAVEKLYADAGGLKGEIRALSADVLKSFNTLGLAGGNEKKE